MRALLSFLLVISLGTGSLVVAGSPPSPEMIELASELRLAAAPPYPEVELVPPRDPLSDDIAARLWKWVASITRKAEFWERRIAKIEEGMARADVEALLPPRPDVLAGTIDGGFQTIFYQLDGIWALRAMYDFHGTDRSKPVRKDEPNYSPANRILAKPKLVKNPIPIDTVVILPHDPKFESKAVRFTPADKQDFFRSP